MENREVVATTDLPYDKNYIYIVVKDEIGNIRIERAKPQGKRGRPAKIKEQEPNEK